MVHVVSLRLDGYTCFHLGSLATQTRRTCRRPPRVCRRVPETPLSSKSYDYFKVHSQKLAGLLARTGLSAFKGIVCRATPFRWRVLCLFQTSLLKAADRPLMPDRRNLARNSSLRREEILSLNSNRWFEWFDRENCSVFFLYIDSTNNSFFLTIFYSVNRGLFNLCDDNS